MLNATRIKIIGAGLSAAVLFAGHSVLPAHAAVAPDAITVADATASDALDVATDPLTWKDPNTTCEADVHGQVLTNGVTSPVAVDAEEAGAADVKCFSLTNLNYTLTARITLQEYNLATRAWVNLPGCVDTVAVTAVEGAAAVAPIVECFDFVGNPQNWHVHRAHVDFWATTGSRGRADSFPPYIITY